MKTFFEINISPKLGMVCLNPTSRMKNVIIYVGEKITFSGVKHVVTLINDKNNVYSVDYDVFCNRYCYVGTSEEKVGKLFDVGEDGDEFTIEASDVVESKRGGILYVIADVYNNTFGKTCCKLISERGAKRTVEARCMKSMFDYKGKSVCDVKNLFTEKQDTDFSVWKLLKKKFGKG